MFFGVMGGVVPHLLTDGYSLSDVVFVFFYLLFWEFTESLFHSFAYNKALRTTQSWMTENPDTIIEKPK